MRTKKEILEELETRLTRGRYEGGGTEMLEAALELGLEIFVDIRDAVAAGVSALRQQPPPKPPKVG